jgi:uncharacterized protein involved in type VI secretion and phage assembly
MLRRSRVGTIPDLTRLSAGVSRPGIDPRINGSRAEALKDSSIDKEHGHYVDVQLLPSGLEMTCRVAMDYAGKEFGDHTGLIYEGDEVYVLLPEGDPALGPIVVARVWSEKYAPPKTVQDHPEDLAVVVKPKLNRRVVTTEDGKQIFDSDGKDDTIILGKEDASEHLVIGDTYRDKQKTMDNSLETQFDNLATAFSTFQSSATCAGILIPAAALTLKAAIAAFCTSGQQAAQALKAAVQQFESDASSNQDFLSKVSKTK